ncbi:MAG: argininosuccinate lyase [Fimbriimonadaceae bacterium]|nr:argininosuccinate lyase [Fimbriimonadaceae bacterium]
MRLWDKGEPTDDLILRFCVGDDYLLDAALVPYDIRASIAHARMLHECGYLTAEDEHAIRDGLSKIGESFANGEWQITPADEDCHTAIENRLVEQIGEAGKRVHLGRSRNDQVLTAVRLWIRDALDFLAKDTESVASLLDELASRSADIPLPGYTHQQRAMPSSVALWARGFASELQDDADGLRLAKRRAQKNPLGSAAGYGPAQLALNRDITTKELGFEETQMPVTAAQLSRGKAEAEAVFAASLLAQDLGRLASDLCLFSTAEFGFVRLPSAFTTGSSIMPQKRNPDVFELVRAKSVVPQTDLQAILAITSKMTSGYHRDLQEIKRPLMNAIAVTRDLVTVMARAIPGIEFDRTRATEAMDDSLFATQRAYQLVVERGMSFRDAYRMVAEEFRDRGR